MNYKFKYEIEDENGDVVFTGSTFISEFISLIGECESVDMEVGKAMRLLRKTRDSWEQEKDLIDLQEHEANLTNLKD